MVPQEDFAPRPHLRQMTTPHSFIRVDLAFIWTKAAVRVSSAALIRLEDDLHDIVDRIRVSRQMIEESRRILGRMNGKPVHETFNWRPQ